LTKSADELLQRTGGQCAVECSSLTVIDELPAIGIGKPPGADVRR
jgi:hypothetical protein